MIPGLLLTHGINIAVTNIDHGAPDNEIGQIFQPFFRVVDARSRRSGAHGVGLAIACKAVTQDEAAILARSTGSGLYGHN